MFAFKPDKNICSKLSNPKSKIIKLAMAGFWSILGPYTNLQTK
jgi:hypothetical protein